MTVRRLVVARGVLTDVQFERDHLAGRHVEVRLADLAAPETVERETADADGVIVTVEPLPRSLIERLGPDVRIIARAGIGLDAIDLEAARERRIAVFHTPDYATEEVATHAVAMILALNRKLLPGDSLARRDWGGWSTLIPVRPLSELTVGVVGLGRIGHAVIERLAPFRCTIVGFDPFVSDAPPGVALASSLEELLARSDVLTLHTPLTEQTRGMIGASELELLGPGAVVVNVSRGPLIHEPALVQALEQGLIAGAALDVLATEPPPPGAPILSAPNVLLSPHFAWYSAVSERRMRIQTLEGALDYLEGRPPRAGRLVSVP